MKMCYLVDIVFALYFDSHKIDYDIYNYNVVDYNKKLVALTFDDGPTPITTQVLDILKEEQVPATFFVLGNMSYGWMLEISYLFDSRTIFRSLAREFGSQDI